ncbi:MAG: PD-(D/E)XK nuclease family transposase [Eubacteriales bacterium]|nr:PD-(D/E)XK nuclease family transposase [Eubacteriales bacterium]
MAQLDFERKHAEDLQRLRGFRLLDDDFMSKVFEDKACSQFLLQIILEKKDLIVQKVHAQHDIKNLQGRSIRLDIIAIDGNGRVYNIEIQRSDKGASIKRARYNSSLLDANVTEPGDDYENLAETYVIFITENDVLKAGLPIYHIDRTIKETGVMFGDEAHIIYVNSQIKDDTELGKLMHDFSCTDAKDMHYKILAERVRYFKEDAKGVEAMCKAMEDMRKEAAAEQNILTLLGAIKNLMKNLGMSAEQAMTALGVSDSERGILIKRI